MIDSLETSSERPDNERLARLKEHIGDAATAVRPLPSDPVMFSIFLFLFLAFSILLAMPVGYQGFLRLSVLQRGYDYSAILLVAALFCVAIVQEIVPGAKRRINPLTLLVLCVMLLSATTVALFPNFDLAYFVKLGVPCLRFGLLCAAISAGLGFWLIRKGFASSPLRFGMVFGAFAGLVGVAALAFHCPILNAAHILVWHCGAMLIGGAIGAVLATFRPRTTNW
jgi:hypothetical protein